MSAPPVDPAAVLNRVVRLARLDMTVFEEVRDDATQTIPAIVIAALATLIAGFGGFLWLIIEFDGLSTGKTLVRVFLLGSIFAILLWVAWVAVAFIVLVQVFKEENANMQALLRTMGYGAIPLAGTIIMLIPAISLGVALIFMVLFFVLQVYAIQAATGTTADRALIAGGAGFAVYALVLAILADSSAMAPGLFTHGIYDFSNLV